MVFLLPASPAHAAGATVTLSTISSGVQTAATSGTVYSALTITGTGFLGASPIAITSLVGTSTTPVNWLTGATCSGLPNSGISTLATVGLNPVDSLAVSGCLTTDSLGNFQVTTLVPILPGGANTITITDSVNTVNEPFTVTPQIVISSHDLSGFPGQTLSKTSVLTACSGGAAVLACLTGFGAGDSITVTSTATASVSIVNSFTAGSAAGTYGVAPIVGTFVVEDATQGAKTITATDATTPSLTASATFTVNPWVAFYDAQTGKTTFSVTSGTPLTSLFIEGHGFPAVTIPQNSITVGGQATTQSAITVSSAGTFGAGIYNQVQLGPPTGGFSLGNLAVVVDGITFSYAAGNIVVGTPGGAAIDNGYYNGQAYQWGGALIGSEPGTAGHGTAFIQFDSSSYKPALPTSSYYGPTPIQNQIGVFGYGFAAAETAVNVGLTNTANTLAGPSYATGTVTAGVVDPDGAFFAVYSLADTPFSNTVPPTSTPTAYAVSATGAGNPATVNSPTFTITPWIDTHTISTNAFGPEVNYLSEATWSVHGFGDGETVAFQIGATAFPTPVTVTVSATGCAVVTALAGCTTEAALSAADQVPDLAGGLEAATSIGGTTGAVASATGAFVYTPIANFVGTTNTLLPNVGGAGTTVTIRTGPSYGVHGLAANTAYNVVWNPLSGPQILSTFTSTATGGIPVPGKQFSIPSDASGLHIVDIQAASGKTSALYDSLYADAASSLSVHYLTQYGDLWFSNTALLTVTPSVATIGLPNTITGSGLSAGTTYVVALGDSSTTLSTKAQALTSFVATSSGAVPAGTTVTLGDTSSGTETGTIEYFQVISAAAFGTTTAPSATGQFVLAANANLNMTTAPAGHAVTITAHALNGPNATSGNPGSVYSVIFNYVQSSASPTVYTGTTVGIIAPNTLGAGSTTFDIPSTIGTGTYAVQLVTNGGAHGFAGLVAGSAVLDFPLSLTVGSVSTACNTTSCFTATGTPTVTTIGANKAVETTFTDNSNAPVTAIVYAVVHNALGQTVSYSTATVTAQSGASATAYDVLFGLAPGTYSVTVFATSTSGTAISTTSTVTVTI